MRNRLLALFAAVTLTACANQPSQQELLNADFGPMPTTGQFVSAVEKAIKRRLKDPSSAQFDYPYHAHKGWFKPLLEKREYGWWTCGLVNAKNSFGGYTGYAHFVAVYNAGRISYLGVEKKAQQYDWIQSVCTNKKNIVPLQTLDDFTVGLSDG